MGQEEEGVGRINSRGRSRLDGSMASQEEEGFGWINGSMV